MARRGVTRAAGTGTTGSAEATGSAERAAPRRASRRTAPSRSRREPARPVPAWRDLEIRALDGLDDPEAWAERAVEQGLEIWRRLGLRYDRRLAERARRRDAVRDVAALAARRCLPLTRDLARPLPTEGLGVERRGFNGLDPADRHVLAGWDPETACRGPRAEHVASALQRLLAAVEEQERTDRHG